MRLLLVGWMVVFVELDDVGQCCCLYWILSEYLVVGMVDFVLVQMMVFIDVELFDQLLVVVVYVQEFIVVGLDWVE